MGGVFLSFEGLDGCGKSTQLARVVAWLRERGHDPLLVREPGGTPLGEQLRSVLLDHREAEDELGDSAEALLYAASRAQLVRAVIRPALEAGRVVLADRFLDSSVAYQGAGRGLGAERVRAANELAVDGLLPHVTILLDLAPQEAEARRASGRASEPDRIERAGAAFFAAAAAAYREIAAAEPERVRVVSAAGTPDEVFAAVMAQLEPAFVRAGVIPEAVS